ncbi:MAG: DUF3181 family protein [Elainella sp.]
MSNAAIEKLAALIGESAYIDVAKWHLYLSDAKLHTSLAEKFYPLLTAGSISDSQVNDVLKGVPVKLGGGKLELPLADLIPAAAQTQLTEALEEFRRDL